MLRHILNLCLGHSPPLFTKGLTALALSLFIAPLCAGMGLDFGGGPAECGGGTPEAAPPGLGLTAVGHMGGMNDPVRVAVSSAGDVYVTDNKRGVPEANIVLDFAGFRTLDSVVRCKEIFGQTKVTIISQQFHNERAIFIAQNKGIDAIGFSAEDVTGRSGLKISLREKLARVKVMLDLIFGVGPKFLGEKVEIK